MLFYPFCQSFPFNWRVTPLTYKVITDKEGLLPFCYLFSICHIFLPLIPSLLLSFLFDFYSVASLFFSHFIFYIYILVIFLLIIFCFCNYTPIHLHFFPFVTLSSHITSLYVLYPLTQIYNLYFMHLSCKSYRKKEKEVKNQIYKKQLYYLLDLPTWLTLAVFPTSLYGFKLLSRVLLFPPEGLPLPFLQSRLTSDEQPQLLFSWECLNYSFIFEKQFCQIQNSWLTKYFSSLSMLFYCFWIPWFLRRNQLLILLTIFYIISCLSHFFQDSVFGFQHFDYNVFQCSFLLFILLGVC